MVFGNVGTAANVDMGRGLQLTYGKDGKPIIENIEGGAAALAEAERIAKKQTSESSSKSTARMINSNINDIRDIYNESSVLNPAFGIGANFAERIGGSNSAHAEFSRPKIWSHTSKELIHIKFKSSHLSRLLMLIKTVNGSIQNLIGGFKLKGAKSI